MRYVVQLRIIPRYSPRSNWARQPSRRFPPGAPRAETKCTASTSTPSITCHSTCCEVTLQPSWLRLDRFINTAKTTLILHSSTVDERLLGDVLQTCHIASYWHKWYLLSRIFYLEVVPKQQSLKSSRKRSPLYSSTPPSSTTSSLEAGSTAARPLEIGLEAPATMDVARRTHSPN